MNRLTSIAWLLAVAGGAYAQGQPSKPKQEQSSVVEAVGCLSQTGANWILEKASDPTPAKTTFSTPEAVKEAAEKPLGTQQIRLLNAAPFGPEHHKGQKMVARGLLIQSGSEMRINLTSFQMVAETCTK